MATDMTFCDIIIFNNLFHLNMDIASNGSVSLNAPERIARRKFLFMISILKLQCVYISVSDDDFIIIYQLRQAYVYVCISYVIL